jgi:hypothetical protein
VRSLITTGGFVVTLASALLVLMRHVATLAQQPVAERRGPPAALAGAGVGAPESGWAIALSGSTS